MTSAWTSRRKIPTSWPHSQLYTFGRWHWEFANAHRQTKLLNKLWRWTRSLTCNLPSLTLTPPQRPRLNEANSSRAWWNCFPLKIIETKTTVIVDSNETSKLNSTKSIVTVFRTDCALLRSNLVCRSFCDENTQNSCIWTAGCDQFSFHDPRPQLWELLK